MKRKMLLIAVSIVFTLSIVSISVKAAINNVASTLNPHKYQYHAYLNPDWNGKITPDEFKTALKLLFNHQWQTKNGVDGADKYFNFKYYSPQCMIDDYRTSAAHGKKIDASKINDADMLDLVDNSTADYAPQDFKTSYQVAGIPVAGGRGTYFSRDPYPDEQLLYFTSDDDNFAWVSIGCGNPSIQFDVNPPALSVNHPKPERLDNPGPSEQPAPNPGPAIQYVVQQQQPVATESLALEFVIGGGGYAGAPGYNPNYLYDGGGYQGGGYRGGGDKTIINNTNIVNSNNNTNTNVGNNYTTNGGGNHHRGGGSGNGGTPSAGPYDGNNGGTTYPPAGNVPGSGGQGGRGSYAVANNPNLAPVNQMQNNARPSVFGNNPARQTASTYQPVAAGTNRSVFTNPVGNPSGNVRSARGNLFSQPSVNPSANAYRQQGNPNMNQRPAANPISYNRGSVRPQMPAQRFNGGGQPRMAQVMPTRGGGFSGGGRSMGARRGR